MMTKQEVSAEYKLTDRGTVASPGKFEAEPWYTVALWNLVLEGGADFETDEDPIVAWFFVDASFVADLAVDSAERDAFAADYPPGSWIGIYENDQGFVYLTSSATDPSAADESSNAQSGYCDCACRDCFDVAITSGGPALCNLCSDAGCDVEGSSECERAPECDNCEGAGCNNCLPESSNESEA